jgi:hypothetical protein
LKVARKVSRDTPLLHQELIALFGDESNHNYRDGANKATPNYPSGCLKHCDLDEQFAHL